MPSPARAAALGILLDVDRGTLLGEALAKTEASPLDSRERAFLHELVLGALRHRGTIDHALRGASDRPLSEIDRGVLQALRLGAYQLLKLRVPPRAAVHESVDLARGVSRKAAPFANAVLRRLLRQGVPRLPDPAKDPLAWLTTAGSLPRWLASRWLAHLGAEAALLRAEALLETPKTVVRFNPRRAGRQRAQEAGVLLRERTVPGAFEAEGEGIGDLAKEGLLYVQDEGSQLVAHLAAAPGLVLDACAAPGGKTTLMADLLGTGVVASEASVPRLRTLRHLVTRWGSEKVLILGGDLARPPFRALFDSVLVDAPCSGLGTLSRHPDLKWRLTEGEIPRQAARQRTLLESASHLVTPGGRLVYATCSTEAEENEDVAADFLTRHSGLFEPEAPPSWAVAFLEGPFLKTRTEKGHGDAFFAAPMRRKA